MGVPNGGLKYFKIQKATKQETSKKRMNMFKKQNAWKKSRKALDLIYF